MMQRLIILIALVSLVSCSVLRHKDKTVTDTHTKTESDSKSVVDSKVEIKVTEEIDTTVKSKELTSRAADVKGLPFRFEDEKHSMVRDEQGNTVIKTKPQDIPVRLKRQTQTKADTKATFNEKKKEDTKVEEKNKSVQVKKSGLAGYGWLLIPLILLALVWYFRKRIPYVRHFFG